MPPEELAVESPAPLSLESQRDAVSRMAELDIDHELGKLNADDYQRTRAALLTQAVAVLQQLDQAQAELEKEVETLVQTRRVGRPWAEDLPVATDAQRLGHVLHHVRLWQAGNLWDRTCFVPIWPSALR